MVIREFMELAAAILFFPQLPLLVAEGVDQTAPLVAMVVPVVVAAAIPELLEETGILLPLAQAKEAMAGHLAALLVLAVAAAAARLRLAQMEPAL